MLQAAGFNLEVADLVLLDFAGERGRKLFHKTNVRGDLVIGDLALAPIANLGFGGFRARLQTHPGRDISGAGQVRNNA